MQYMVDTKALKKLMVENEINTISELEAQSGINRNTLSDILNGVTFPSAKVIGRLIDVFHIPNENVGGIFFVPFDLQ